MTAAQPIAVLARRRARHGARSRRSSSAAPDPEDELTTTAGAPAPTTIVFGTDGWRARIADEYTFENVRRCADGVAHYVVERGEQAKGVVIAYDRRFASEHFAAAAAEVLLAHDIPVALRVARGADPDELVRGRRAGFGRRHRHHREPQPVGRQRVQGQGADRRGRRAPTSSSVIEARIAVNGGAPIERRPLADAEAAGLVERFDPFDGLRAVRPADGRPRRAQGGRHRTSSSIRCGAPGAGWLSRLLAGGRIRVTRDPPGAQPVLRRRQPGADPAQRRRGARDASRAAATTWACCSTAMRIGPARPTSAARSSTSSR